jgi:hypothetical protein
LETLTDGDIAVVTVTYKGLPDPTTRIRPPVDPATPSLVYTIQGVAQPVIQYAGGTTPAVGTYIRSDAGVYIAWLNTTGKPGTWEVEGKGAGPGQAASRPEKFVVRATL